MSLIKKGKKRKKERKKERNKERKMFKKRKARKFVKERDSDDLNMKSIEEFF
jgi:hypothetical protein